MLVFLLPGFTSQSPNRKFYTLKKNLSECEFIGLSYSTYDPGLCHDRFCKSINYAIQYHNDNDIMFIGTSLGAFWAKYLSSQYKNSKYVMINPALSPWESLKNHVGFNTNMYSNEVFHISEKEINEYSKYDISPDNKSLTLLDEGDELFSYTESIERLDFELRNNTIITFPGGNHSFDHLEESLPFIRDFIGLG